MVNILLLLRSQINFHTTQENYVRNKSHTKYDPPCAKLD